MGVSTPISLSDGFYLSESLPVSSQVCKNMYVNIPETQGKISDAQLFPAPGLVEIAYSGDNEINRGAHVLSGKPYFVNGNKLYRLQSSDELIELGEIEGSKRVSMTDNGRQLLIIVPGTRVGYIYTEQDGLTQITDSTFTDTDKAAPEICVFIDGYFVVTRGSKEFFCSNLNNGLVYGALDFGSAEADPDVIRSAHVHKNQLYIFGSETIEVFQNVGGVGFPFQRIQGFVIPKGIAAPFSVKEFDSSFVFIGQGVDESPKIYIFTGSGVAPISTTSIDFLLQEGSTDIENAFVWAYSFRGATFVGFSNVNGTFVYDSQASKLVGKKVWHTRDSYQLAFKTRWRVNSIVTAYGKLIAGDSEGGTIGRIDNKAATEYGNPLLREFALQTLENNSSRMFFNSIEAVLDSGLGLEDGSTPKIRMSYSDDGRTYCPERTRSTGKVGQYSIKAKWAQLGSTDRYRIFKFNFDDPVRLVVLKVVINIDG